MELRCGLDASDRALPKLRRHVTVRDIALLHLTPNPSKQTPRHDYVRWLSDVRKRQASCIRIRGAWGGRVKDDVRLLWSWSLVWSGWWSVPALVRRSRRDQSRVGVGGEPYLGRLGWLDLVGRWRRRLRLRPQHTEETPLTSPCPFPFTSSRTPPPKMHTYLSRHLQPAVPDALHPMRISPSIPSHPFPSLPFPPSQSRTRTSPDEEQSQQSRVAFWLWS